MEYYAVRHGEKFYSYIVEDFVSVFTPGCLGSKCSANAIAKWFREHESADTAVQQYEVSQIARYDTDAQ